MLPIAEGRMPESDEPGVRVTATLSAQQDRVLRGLAAKNKVSVAWLIRYAVDRLIEQGETVQLSLNLSRRGS